MQIHSASVVASQAARDIPVRRRNSVRRTTSIEIAWPNGRDASAELTGTGRDILTRDPASPPMLLRHDMLHARVSPDKIVEAIRTDPPVGEIDALVGGSVLAGFRKRLQTLPGVADVADRPVTLLLDDLVGCSIISGWVWSKWITEPAELARWSGNPRAMENACISYAPGASVFENPFYLKKIDPVPAPDVAGDAYGLHPLAPDAPQTMRRLRVIDVSEADGVIAITTMFQDSGMVPGDRRSAVHEYALHATADRVTGRLLTLNATPGVLPHPECVGAPANLARLIGTPLVELRETVLRELRGAAGCTHLNDAVRALAEAPILVRALDPERADSSGLVA